MRGVKLKAHGALATSLLPTSVVFSGIQPTGIPHLGNYLGAMKKWVELQKTAPSTTQLTFMIADLHAHTNLQLDLSQLSRMNRETLATFLAMGLDPDRCTIFTQSDVKKEHLELKWVLEQYLSHSRLERMTSWKSKLAECRKAAPYGVAGEVLLSDGDVPFEPPHGLFEYPALQAADVLLYGTTHVPVGADQVQHIEFARHCARAFNDRVGKQLLKEPEVLLSPARWILSLTEPSRKMSKSHKDPRSRILLTDTDEVIASKVKGALTDSIPGISYDPENRPGVSNILAIMSHISADETSPENLAKELAQFSLGALKRMVADCISSGLREIREKYYQITLNNQILLDEIANAGAVRARGIASSTIEDVNKALYTSSN